jgi:hypothetical protein
MKNKKIVERLLDLRDSHIDMIDAKEGLNRTCGLASNHVELINIIADLLKTSKKALDGINVAEESYISEPEYNIADVIGIAIKLLPFSEMQFIDEALEVLNEQIKS